MPTRTIDDCCGETCVTAFSGFYVQPQFQSLLKKGRFIMRHLITALGILLVLSDPFLAQDTGAPEQWTPEHGQRQRTLGDEALSPAGKWVVFTVNDVIMSPTESRYLSHIWLGAVDGSRCYQLTRGEESCTSPRWSPDGKWIAFISARSGKNNIWLIRPGGGEACRLTDCKSNIYNLKWSAAGDRIAFIMRDPETEEQRQAREGKRDPKIIGKGIRYSHLYVVEVKPRDSGFPEVRRLTDGDFEVTAFDWSPDGGTITFSHQPQAGWNDFFGSELSQIHAEGGEIRPLVRQPSIDWYPLYSPDGKWIAFYSSRGRVNWAPAGYVSLVPASGGEIKLLANTPDEDPTLIRWKEDGSGLYVAEFYHTSSRIYFIPADGGKPEVAAHVKEGFISLSADVSADCRLAAYGYENMSSRPEIYVCAAGGEHHRISGVNADFPDLPYARSEVITWKTADGAEIEALLTYPLDYRPDTRYPILLIIHGGPAAVHYQNHTIDRNLFPTQAFAAAGFAVLRPNPRGSGGYGLAFREAVYRDFGGIDYRDLLAGIDHLISTGLADPDRLGVMGWSYGGYMTAWIISQTDGFKAACVGAGLTDLVSFTNTTDVVDWLPNFFGAELPDDHEFYQSRSPLYHVRNIKTPTLIVHGEVDVRVPHSQSWEFYNALKRQGLEVELALYPRTPHGVREPKLRLDIAERNLKWFKEHLPAK
jgi:dipeptidyl aminopeptidase/acylaminoacyl peptidase